jgi:hypothetical protein
MTIVKLEKERIMSAKQKTEKKKQQQKRKEAETAPKFPYTTKPSSLRRLLQEIPNKPRPLKFDKKLLKSWGYADANDYSMIRVMKALGLLNSNNEPTELYAQYMNLQTGSTVLAEPIKSIYQPLFNASVSPYDEDTKKLQNLFNIHSGGSERSIEQQIQTFKALCENTAFDGVVQQPPPSTTTTSLVTSSATGQLQSMQSGPTSVNINVHIHLPENKSRRDYECMIEDIGKYIFGRTQSGGQNDQ